MKKELTILRKAKEAGLLVREVTYKGHRRKGYDLIDPNKGYVQYTLIPVSYSPGMSHSKQKWIILNKASAVRQYVTRMTAKLIDLSQRAETGYI